MLALPASAQNPANGGADGHKVIAFLNQSIAWYRHFPAEQQLVSEPGDVLFLNENRDLADRIVRLSFDFARAETDLLAKTPAANGSAAEQNQPSSYLPVLEARAEQQVKQAQSEIEVLQRRLPNATGHSRKILESALAESQSELDLAQTRLDVFRNMLQFVNGTTAGGTAGLSSEIEELARTVPAEQSANASAVPGAAAANTGKRSESSSLFGIIGNLIALAHQAGTLHETITLTDNLTGSAVSLRAPLIASLKELSQHGGQIAGQPQSNDPAVLASQKNEMDAITLQFKQRSQALVPLAKQKILLDLYRRNLVAWQNSIQSQRTTALKALSVRLALLGLALAALAVASRIWQRAILRYVQDARRRHQLTLFRQVATWLAAVLVLTFAFATELGSLVTFAGLMTAGVAVALQNVILSVVGYFFLIGKYGVRAGDRVQISGVDGEVLDIGLIRLHLMEICGNDNDAQATGRVVAFSNSVVFQANGGLFRQIPGTHFVWHQITLTLAPEADYRSVEQRLLGAVEDVFTSYRDTLEVQHRHMQRTLGSTANHSLHPKSRLRLTQSGLEVVIHYPLDLDNAAEIDDRITRALLDAIDREPKLKLVGSATPNLQTSVMEPVGR